MQRALSLSQGGHKLESQKQINGIDLTFQLAGKKQTLDSEILLMAVGIIGNTENIGLENTKVKVERGHVVTDDLMQTSENGIYAIGDVTGTPWLAHKASHEGIIAAEAISGKKPHKITKNNVA